MHMKQRPFTLIELLVVVAIIAILASLLLPGLGRARSRAQVAVCASNLRQSLIAVMLYAEAYEELPTNETLAPDAWYYRYRTRQGNGIMWIRQVAGDDGWRQEAFKCPETLPADNARIGTIPADGQSWTWAARSAPSRPDELWSAATVANRRRAWYAYQGPLRPYEVAGWVACSDYDVQANAWDLWGDAWRGNSSLSPLSPIDRRSPQNSANFLHSDGMRVLLYCPAMVRMHGSSTWWHEWRSPHLEKAWDNDAVRLTPLRDSRNYAFNDGHVVLVNQ